MKQKNCVRPHCLAALFIVVAFTASAEAGEKILHTFHGPSASQPAWLIADPAGNLYGTVAYNEYGEAGSVFELSPKAGGGWSYRLLYAFNRGEGIGPNQLVMDSARNLYGTTYGGGAYGCGIAYELSPTLSGPWLESTLLAFNCGSTGTYTFAGLTLDTSGNLYGTTWLGGPNNYGTVFELSPELGGTWSYTLLHSFTLAETGSEPSTVLALDEHGNIYGGGNSGIFVLSPNPGGTWNESTAYAFDCANDGCGPSGLIFDAAGNLYGANGSGGAGRAGTVFVLSPAAGGAWSLAVLQDFTISGSGGATPSGNLLIDAAGDIFGTTIAGGQHDSGVVYRLHRQNGTLWSEVLLDTFSGGQGGAVPEGLASDREGNLYSTARMGGAGGEGFVLEIIP